MAQERSPLLAYYGRSGVPVFDTDSRPLEATLRSENNLLGLARGTGIEMAKLTFAIAALPNNPELAVVVDTEILMSVLESYKLGLDRLPTEYRTRAMVWYTSTIVEAFNPTDGSNSINNEIDLDALQNIISIIQDVKANS